VRGVGFVHDIDGFGAYGVLLGHLCEYLILVLDGVGSTCAGPGRRWSCGTR
jgi:hypothetical protein